MERIKSAQNQRGIRSDLPFDFPLSPLCSTPVVKPRSQAPVQAQPPVFNAQIHKTRESDSLCSCVVPHGFRFKTIKAG